MSAKRSKHTAAAHDDARWFRAHPTRYYRFRFGTSDDAADYVVVHQPTPGLRYSYGLTGPNDDEVLVLLNADDALLAEVFHAMMAQHRALTGRMVAKEESEA